MRITNNMLINNMVYNLNQNLKTLERLQYQQATGKKFRVPSEAPIAASKSLKFNTDISKLEQYRRNTEDALSWMSDTEAALAEINEVLKRAYELTVDAANGTKHDEDLLKIKEEIDQLKKHLVQMANTTFSGRYLFSGYSTDKPLLSDDGTYNIAIKSNEVFSYNIGNLEKMEVNITGLEVFGVDGSFDAESADIGDKPELIKILEDLSTALENNNTDGIQESIGKVQSSQGHILSVRAKVGARMNRLELTQSRLDLNINNAKELLSYNEDVDITEVIMNISMAENVYVSSLMVGAKIIQPSLVQFLS